MPKSYHKGNSRRSGVRYKVTVFTRPKKIKLPFLKVTVSESYRFYVVESYRCQKVTVILGRKLPFFVIKLPFLVIKLPFISEKIFVKNKR